MIMSQSEFFTFSFFYFLLISILIQVCLYSSNKTKNFASRRPTPKLAKNVCKKQSKKRINRKKKNHSCQCQYSNFSIYSTHFYFDELAIITVCKYLSLGLDILIAFIERVGRYGEAKIRGVAYFFSKLLKKRFKRQKEKVIIFI